MRRGASSGPRHEVTSSTSRTGTLWAASGHEGLVQAKPGRDKSEELDVDPKTLPGNFDFVHHL